MNSADALGCKLEREYHPIKGKAGYSELRMREYNEEISDAEIRLNSAAQPCEAIHDCKEP